ncbi:hypothetical protein D3C72_1972740 [compost metagenome]
MLLGHAFATVTQAQGQGFTVVLNLFNAQGPAFTHGFYGIGNQAVENLPEQARLAEHPNIAQGIELNLDALAFELQGEGLQAVL